MTSQSIHHRLGYRFGENKGDTSGKNPVNNHIIHCSTSTSIHAVNNYNIRFTTHVLEDSTLASQKDNQRDWRVLNRGDNIDTVTVENEG